MLLIERTKDSLILNDDLSAYLLNLYESPSLEEAKTSHIIQKGLVNIFSRE